MEQGHVDSNVDAENFGIDFDDGFTRLLAFRFADDLLLFAFKQDICYYFWMPWSMRCPMWASI